MKFAYTSTNAKMDRATVLETEIKNSFGSFPSDAAHITDVRTEALGHGVYSVIVSVDESEKIWDGVFRSAINNAIAHGFKFLMEEDLIFVFKDIENQIDREYLLNSKVIIVGIDAKHQNGITLREAIEEFGIQSEGKLDDIRLFARCPTLNGLCGPMYPNDGFIARYETWKTYDMLSR